MGIAPAPRPVLRATGGLNLTIAIPKPGLRIRFVPWLCVIGSYLLKLFFN